MWQTLIIWESMLLKIKAEERATNSINSSGKSPISLESKFYIHMGQRSPVAFLRGQNIYHCIPECTPAWGRASQRPSTCIVSIFLPKDIQAGVAIIQESDHNYWTLLTPTAFCTYAKKAKLFLMITKLRYQISYMGHCSLDALNKKSLLCPKVEPLEVTES